MCCAMTARESGYPPWDRGPNGLSGPGSHVICPPWCSSQQGLGFCKHFSEARKSWSWSVSEQSHQAGTEQAREGGPSPRRPDLPSLAGGGLPSPSWFPQAAGTFQRQEEALQGQQWELRVLLSLGSGSLQTPSHHLETHHEVRANNCGSLAASLGMFSEHRGQSDPASLCTVWPGPTTPRTAVAEPIPEDIFGELPDATSIFIKTQDENYTH